MPKDIAEGEIEQFKWEYEEAKRQVKPFLKNKEILG